MKIEEFKPEYAEDVCTVICKTLRGSNSKDYSSDVISNLEEHYSPDNLIRLSDHRMIFCVCDPDVIGTIGVQGNVICGLFVRPERQGEGIGRMLMDQAERYLIEKEYTKAILNSSTTALGFYLEQGYQKLEEESSEEFGPHVKMEKKIGSIT